MTTDAADSSNSTLRNQLSNVFMIVGGLIVLIVHLVLYVFSKDVFNIIMSIYIIAFAIIFLVFLQKKKLYTSDNEYTVLSYISFFVIGIELMVLILSFVGLYQSGNKYTYKGPVNTRYNTYYK